MKKQFIETGCIVGTHGVRGEMRFQPWADSPESLLDIKKLYLDEKGKKSLNITGARVHKTLVLLSVEGIDSIEAAEKLRSRILFINRDDLDIQGGYLIADLISCVVFDFESGVQLGTLCDVSKTGANDVWHIKKDGREYLIPAIPDVVKTVDIDNEKIYITPLKGIFNDED